MIAIFLLAAIGSVAFGIGRLFLMEANLAGLYENSTIAYYAAESGIEEGMLRYRYDKNQQLPLTLPMSDNIFNPGRINVNNLDWTDPSSAMWNDVAAFQPTNLTQHIYGLQMHYKGTMYGYDANNSGTLQSSDLADSRYELQKDYLLTRDSSIKLDVTNLATVAGTSDGDVRLFVRPLGGSCATGYSLTGGDKPFMEAKVSGTIKVGPNDEVIEQKVKLIYESLAGLAAHTIKPTGIPSGVPRYDNLLTAIRNTTTSPIFTSGKVELFLKPIGCDVVFGLAPMQANITIPQPYTTVKSTGYYGGVTRTLEAKIDRQAGTLYDLFDFVMYDRP